MASFRVSSHLSRVSPGTVLLYKSVSVGEHLGILPCPGLAHVCHQLENLLTNKKKRRPICDQQSMRNACLSGYC